MDYNLWRLAKRPRGADSVALPPIHESRQGVKNYRKVLLGTLRDIRRMAADARDGADFERLYRISETLTQRATGAVNGILAIEAHRHTKTFHKIARRALAVDLRAIVRDEDLTELLKLAGLRNAGLIKSINDEQVKRIQQAVIENVMDGAGASALKDKLVKDSGILAKRADLIAQDQISKLNSDLNRFRHEQAGIAEYRWLTSRDERVRERHRALDGKVYKYGEATGAEEGLPPGKPIRCRCVAQAIVRFGGEDFSRKLPDADWAAIDARR